MIGDDEFNDDDETSYMDEYDDETSYIDEYEESSDEEITSGENNMVMALSQGEYEIKKVGASRSAIEGLKREAYTYESGGADAHTCVICMDKFESRIKVAYMPCSHFFHEYCLVPWLQENNSCPLCRFEIQSCSLHQFTV
ncbi:hypothetical protein MKW94_017968 [Papaver nudicaule]|uniref:RING-type domain-containing protein n=1 Tax=Papaver nudicaule TaxID=74823 RepID=A0AA41S6X0_PAPNU|nr:hypothetical protein [Papaver nudicaule]